MKNKNNDDRKPIGFVGTVPIYLVARERLNLPSLTNLIVSFDCPCGKTHDHGMSKNDDRYTPTHRVAHCSSMIHPKGYYIVRAVKS